MAGQDALGVAGYADAVPVAVGGSSTVWRARETAFDREVAVKVVSRPVLDDDVRRRFERELSLTGRLSSHPHVLTVHARGFTADGRPYVTSEFCPAGSLADVVAQHGPLSAAQVAEVGVRVASALQAAHDEGVVHRDVKPQNVLVTAYGQPALADFGIAFVSADVTSPTDSLTPSHAAPEVLQGGTAGPSADVWGLGSTLWTLLAGTPPYAPREGEGVLPVMLRILQDPLPEDPDPALAPVLRRLLAKDPADRPSAAEAAGLLQPHAAGAAPLPTTPLRRGATAAEPTLGRRPAGVRSAPATGDARPLLPVPVDRAAQADLTVQRQRAARPADLPADDAPTRRRPLLVGAAALVVLLVAGSAAAVAVTRDEQTVTLADRGAGAAATAAPSTEPGATTPPPTPEATAPAPSTDAVAPAPAGGGAAPAPAVAPPGGGVPAAPAPAPEAAGGGGGAAAPPQPAPAPAPPAGSPAAAPAPAPAPEPAPAQPARFPVFRCEYAGDARAAGDQLYTSDAGCRSGYSRIGQAWEVAKEAGLPDTTGLWRLSRPASRPDERVHLITFDRGERDRLLAGGWALDGQMGWVRTTPATGWTRITRLHNGTHYAYANDASVGVWTNRGYRVEATFYS